MTSLLSGLVFDSANDTINGDTTENVTAEIAAYTIVLVSNYTSWTSGAASQAL